MSQSMSIDVKFHIQLINSNVIFKRFKICKKNIFLMVLDVFELINDFFLINVSQSLERGFLSIN